MSWYINKIIIDTREKLRGFTAYNYYSSDYDVVKETLPFGDYCFCTTDDKEVVFEFKTCEDFIKSMEDESLFHELSNQSIHHDYSYLVVCGDFNKTYRNLYYSVPQYRYNYKTPAIMKRRLNAQVNGALNRIYAMYVPVIFVEDEKTAFEKMLKISLKVSDSKKYGGLVRPSKKNLKENPTAIFLTSINRIGEKKAKNIIDDLDIKCLDDLCNRKPSDFLSVSLIKKEMVKELWKKIHNEDLSFE